MEVRFVIGTTVCIPVYNGSKSLERAIISVLQQTYQDFRLVISDNWSTDGSLDIALNTMNHCPNGVVAGPPQHLPAMEHFKWTLENFGDTQYFVWLAHDDYWKPEFLQKLQTKLSVFPESDVCMSAYTWVTPENEVLRTFYFQYDLDPGRCHPSTTFWRNIQGDTSMGGNFGPYNHWIYGLWRTTYLKKAFNQLNTLSWDRIFTTQASLGTTFTYVNHALFFRTKEAKTQEHKATWPNVFLSFINLWWTLTTSRVIPIHRKAIMPLAVARYILNYMEVRK